MRDHALIRPIDLRGWPSRGPNRPLTTGCCGAEQYRKVLSTKRPFRFAVPPPSHDLLDLSIVEQVNPSSTFGFIISEEETFIFFLFKKVLSYVYKNWRATRCRDYGIVSRDFNTKIVRVKIASRNYTHRCRTALFLRDKGRRGR